MRKEDGGMIDTLKKRLALFYASWCFLIVIKFIIDLFFIDPNKIKFMITINILPILIFGCVHITTYFLSGYKGIYLQLAVMVITAMTMIVASVVDQYWLLLALMIGQNAYFYRLYNKHTLLKVSFSIFILIIIVGLAIGFNIKMGKTEEIFYLTVRHYLNHAFFWVLPIGNIIISLYWNHHRLKDIINNKSEIIEIYQGIKEEIKDISKELKHLMNDVKYNLDKNEHIDNIMEAKFVDK